VGAHALRSLQPTVAGHASVAGTPLEDPEDLEVVGLTPYTRQHRPYSPKPNPAGAAAQAAANPPPAAARGGEPVTPAPTSKPRNSAPGTFLLVLALLVVAAVGTVVWNPSLITSARDWRAARTDPYLQAERALAEGRSEAARTSAQAALGGARDADARLLLGKLSVADGDREHGREYLRQAAAADPEWRIAWEAGGILRRMNDLDGAARAYRTAFEGGAPPEHWPAIAEVQEANGNLSFGRYLRDLIERSSAGADAAVEQAAPETPS
jgi:hypothetical protein